ncbi:hypothetical protein NE237_016649 [Protea cynaroides]|uniref:Uncharacterized protein n=1 Tax=Protea cynaroides TaxID=273540 RepID=A0A9Q0HFD6_9MAGN|nr:hypothetical protein NE237_016649 [Protea cynaroides]
MLGGMGHREGMEVAPGGGWAGVALIWGVPGGGVEVVLGGDGGQPEGGVPGGGVGHSKGREVAPGGGWAGVALGWGGVEPGKGEQCPIGAAVEGALLVGGGGGCQTGVRSVGILSPKGEALGGVLERSWGGHETEMETTTTCEYELYLSPISVESPGQGALLNRETRKPNARVRFAVTSKPSNSSARKLSVTTLKLRRRVSTRKPARPEAE